MRPALTILISLTMLFAAAAPAPAVTNYRTGVFTIDSTEATINGQPLSMDVAPFIDPATGAALLPVRYLAEALGAQVAWDPASRTVTLIEPGTVVVLTLGSTGLSVDGQALTMDVAPCIAGPGRTMLPARWVAQAFGFTVHWLPATRMVIITDQPPVTVTAPSGPPAGKTPAKPATAPTVPRTPPSKPSGK